MIHTLFSTKKKYAKIQTIFLRPPIFSSRNHLQALKVLLKLSPQCKFNLTAPFPKGHSPSNSDMMIYQNRIESELLDFSVANRYHIGGRLKTLPKAQRTRGLSSYHKFKHKSCINFKITTKHQPLHKTCSNLASESRQKFNFITFTKHQHRKTGQTPAANLA